MWSFDRWVAKNYANVVIWLDKLRRADDWQSQFFLHALRREFEFQNCPRQRLEGIFEEFDSFLAVRSADDPLLAFAKFIDDMESKWPRDIYLEGNIVDQSTWDQEGIRCMKSFSFFTMIDPMQASDFLKTPEARYNIKFSQGAGEYMMERLYHNELTTAELAKRNAEIAGLHGFFWACRADLVEKWCQQSLHVESVGQNASGRKFQSSELTSSDVDSLQKWLGLRYYNDRLIAIYFPLYGEGGELPHVPTVANARGESPFFRPAWRKDCWGEAVDLAGPTKGAPEAIKLNIPWHQGFRNPKDWGELPREKFNPDGNWVQAFLSISERGLSQFVLEPRECSCVGGGEE